ncbi:MAG: glycosyltransferase family 2 protein [Candidatus Edwardsbacteria bacterium]|nr:glycosyltransferase family 2 protein [Candidatus Edwardsbacteria bacterium]MBU2594218.1 glycosyltransferase family 2 protein [Candidatus Edwardsbacteria bacterium]
MPPFVSIILPVRNEEKFIIPCLQSIFLQDYPSDKFEVIIIDGRSDDSTIDSIAEFKIQNPKSNIIVLDNPKKVVSAGLNIGFKAAKGDIIIRMDAHAAYGRDYISQCLAALEKSGAANVGGPALALPGGQGALANAIALAHYSPFGLGGGQFRNPGAEGFVETVWPGCFRREVFDKVGYIDERRTRTEDLEFNTRLRMAGYKIFITPLIRAYYYCRTTLWETWRQRWADGYEITHFLPDNPKAPRLRHFVPLIFIGSLILLFWLSWLSAGGWGYRVWGHGAGANFLIRGLKDLGLVKLPGIFSLKVWCWNLLFIRLLVLELGAYFTVMALAVGQVALSEKRKAKSGTAQFKEGQSIHNSDTMSKQLYDNGNTIVSQPYHNDIASLLLLPIVFMTLHFSYGLGSIWGLVTLAGWAKKRNNV